VLRTPEEFSEYLRIAQNPQQFDTFQQRHGFSYVVLPVVYPDRYLGLIAHLYESPAWKLIFTDGACVLFARAELTRQRAWDLGASATTDQILKAAALHFGDSPRLLDAARLQLATLDVAVGESAQVERVLSASESAAARALRARARLAAGDIEGAQAIADQLIGDPDAEVQDLDLMAMVHMRRGRLQEATSVLRRALAIDPFDREAIRLLAEVEEHRHEP
jgi:tetratricopeptide (TPR) repeat protein